MFDFAFEPLIVGDTSSLGLIEEIQEQKVNAAINWIRENLKEPIPVSQIDMALEKFHIDYNELPHWLASKFDEFEVC